MRWIDLPVAEMAVRYAAGDSTRVLGLAYGVGSTTVRRRLRGAGIRMRPGVGVCGNRSKLGQYKRGGPLSTSQGHLVTRDRKGRQRYVHRGCWETHHGPIANGFVIHHVDGEPLNNAIENLECLSCGEHARWHRTKGNH